MKLASKVTFATGAVTLIATLLLGASVLYSSYSSGAMQNQKRLNDIAAEVLTSAEDKLSTALLVVDSQEIGLSYVQADGQVTVLQELESQPTYLMSKSLYLEDNEKLIFTISNRAIFEAAMASGLQSALLSVIASALATLFTYLILRRDIASMVAKVESSKREMQSFLSDASHELRTPLTVIRGYLEMLQNSNEIPAEKRKLAISRAHAEALRMQDLIKDILSLAELGQLPELELKNLDLRLLIENQIVDFKELEPNRPIEFLYVPNTLVNGSERLLEQLVTNIFGNIRSHTPPNSKVLIQLQKTPSSFQILVQDAGPGINDLHSGQVLTEFRRFDTNRSRVGGGSGLGLSIMAKIAELHGGSMELKKSSLGGLCVSVNLPKTKES